MLQGANILITGVTGLIGGELVRRLASCGVGKVYCLIRPTAHANAADRLIERFRRGRERELPREANAVEAVPGDVTAPRFGMSDADARRVADSVDLVIHCASELSFIRDASCRQTNIAGMHNLINLVQECRRAPGLVHISTATVCGDTRHRTWKETDATHHADEHHNEYTRTKAAAERVLRDSGLPALVIRPSIVLSAELPSENFAKAILWFLPLLNEFEAVPIDPASRVDVVPVSFVVDAMIRLLERPSPRYDCYHVSAGPQQVMRCGHVARFLDEFHERANPLQLIRPEEWTPGIHRRYVQSALQRKCFATIRHYLPFLNMDVAYDNSRLREELGDEAARIPHVTDYLAGLLRLVTPKLQLALAR
ncbi:MAG TPA: SDR family oxidoreductase [Phycisphaerae bacterium]|nr:SDR family oxidoreductase [Phycisphaerae bacterium]